MSIKNTETITVVYPLECEIDPKTNRIMAVDYPGLSKVRELADELVGIDLSSQVINAVSVWLNRLEPAECLKISSAIVAFQLDSMITAELDSMLGMADLQKELRQTKAKLVRLIEILNSCQSQSNALQA